MAIERKVSKIMKFTESGNETRKTIQNFNWLVSNRVITLIIGMFVMAAIARYFGPVKYGMFNYAVAFNSFFVAISTLGFETLAVKAIIDKEYDENIVLFTSFSLRFFASVFLTVISMLFIRLIEPDDTSLQMLVFIMSLIMIIKSTDVIEYWTHAYQRAKISSLIQMAAYIFSAILKLLLVLFGGNLYHLALIYLIEALIIAVSYTIAYWKKKSSTTKLKFDKEFARSILSKSRYLIISSLMVTIYMKIDQVMLGTMLSDKAELGIYSASSQIATMWYFIPIAIITSFKPIILKNKNRNEEEYKLSIQKLYRLIGWISTGFAIFVFLFSDLIINILYGPEYAGASKILTVSIWAGVFAMLGNVTAVWLVCENLHRYKIVFVLSGAIINVGFNMIAIPQWGAIGAAVVTLFSQILANFITPLIFKDVRYSSIMMLKSFFKI